MQLRTRPNYLRVLRDPKLFASAAVMEHEEHYEPREHEEALFR